MNNLYLADSHSINLNFLLYIRNLYLSIKDEKEVKSIFPWLSIDKGALLNENEFKEKAKQLWTTVFDSISESVESSGDLNKKDIECWINNKFSFSELFISNSLGEEHFKNIKNSFESWYWGCGSQMCGIFSGPLVKKYYHLLIKMGETRNQGLIDGIIHLQVVYDTPPRDWKMKGKNMLIISPNNPLPSLEEMFEMCLMH